MTKPLDGRTVLVTGANGGLGERFVRQALERGAARVYAAARSPREWGDPRILNLDLDLTDAASIDRAAAAATDVDLLVNNAGIAPAGDSMATGSDEQLRQIFETNVFGPLRLSRALASVLAANGGGTIVNVLSAAAWLNLPTVYSASKAAFWSVTNGLREALAGQETQVVGVLVGMIDTPMAERWDIPKVSAESVVAKSYDGVTAGSLEVLADEGTVDLKAMLGTPAEQLYPALAQQLAGFAA